MVRRPFRIVLAKCFSPVEASNKKVHQPQNQCFQEQVCDCWLLQILDSGRSCMVTDGPYPLEWMLISFVVFVQFYDALYVIVLDDEPRVALLTGS